MLSCKHSNFTLSPAITYLNCAYMSPLFKKAEKAGLRAIRMKRNPSAITPDMFFEETNLLRTEFAKLLNTGDPSRIAIVPSVSYGMATVAKNLNLQRGQEIIIAAEQFPSNVYPWKSISEEVGGEVKVVSPPDITDGRGEAWNNRILESITAKTRAVAIGNVHWTDGTKFHLEAIRKRTLEVGALLIIDGTQSVGALPFDVSVVKPDALICAGYKWLLGPYSVGLAYYGEYFDAGKPIEENWINRLNSENFSELVNYQSQYHPGAVRYDVGEHSNFILLPMMLKAVQQLNRWGVENVQEYCQSITRDPILKLKENNFWVEDENFRSGHMFGIRIPPSFDIEIIKQKLARKNIFVSFRGSAIRVSPNVYNRQSDLEKFIHVLLSK
jgi:selenocysteine lyase/cysteine desulfurase